jgi:glycerophosphoryl diester phosphodiesterase
MWELDVAVSADGTLFVFHDFSLTRTSNAQQIFPDRAPWIYANFTLAELEKLDYGSWYVETDPFGQIAAGAVTVGQAARYRGEVLLSLRRALEYTREYNWRVNVEIKALPAPLQDFPVAAAVVALIEKLQVERHVLLSSFNYAVLRQVVARNDAIAVAALAGHPKDMPLQGPPDVLSLTGYFPRYSMVTVQQIRALQAHGHTVMPWVVNDAAEMSRLVDAGVSGIFTDFPQRLQPLLQPDCLTDCGFPAQQRVAAKRDECGINRAATDRQRGRD